MLFRSSATLGKTAGKDAAQDKATFPALIGLEGSRARLQALSRTLADMITPLGPRGDALAALARLAVDRTH